MSARELKPHEIEAEQEAFERECPGLNPLRYIDDSAYCSEVVEYHWKGWLAARRADLEIPRPDTGSHLDLTAVPSNELQLELRLREGPRFQCQASDCRAYASAPGKWDACPSCNRKGYLCGSFKDARESAGWKAWEQALIVRFRAAGRKTCVESSDCGEPTKPEGA